MKNHQGGKSIYISEASKGIFDVVSGARLLAPPRSQATSLALAVPFLQPLGRAKSEPCAVLRTVVSACVRSVAVADGFLSYCTVRSCHTGTK